MTRLGMFSWVQATDGALRGRDRLVLLAQAARYGAATLPWEIRRALGLQLRAGADRGLALVLSQVA